MSANTEVVRFLKIRFIFDKARKKLSHLDALVPSQTRGFNKSSFTNSANKILLTKMSFHVVRQLVLEVEPLVADRTGPVLNPLVDQLVFGSGWRPPEHLVTRESAFVLLLSGVLGHVHSKVVLCIASEVAMWAGERIGRSFMGDFLVKVISAFSQIFRVAEVTLEGENSGVPENVILQGDFCFVTFSTFLTGEIPCIAVLHHVSIHTLLTRRCEITVVTLESSIQVVSTFPVGK